MDEIEKIKETFAKKLNHYMEMHQLNQVDISKIAGVSQQSVSNWLSKKLLPRMGVIEKLANHFGISKTDLLEENNQEEEMQAFYSKATPQQKANMQKRTLDNVKGFFDEATYNLLVNYLNCNDKGKELANDRLVELVKLYPKED